MARKKRDYLYQNGYNYEMIYTRLKSYAIANFEWINLPNSINPRFLEDILFEQGKICFFFDEDLGYLALPCTSWGLNVYREPTHFDILSQGDTGYTAMRDMSNAVLIYNNTMRLPSRLVANYYAERIYNYESTIDVNVNAQKTPVLIECDADDLLTLQNTYDQYADNKPVIFSRKKSITNALSILSTEAKFVAKDVNDVKNTILHEALTYLGVNNSNQDKKERLLESEVESNNGEIISSRNNMLLMRKLACDQINTMFGLNIDVRFRCETIGEENNLPDENEDGGEGEEIG